MSDGTKDTIALTVCLDPERYRRLVAYAAGFVPRKTHQDIPVDALVVVGISLIAPSYVWVQWTIDHPILKPLWSDKEGKFSRWRAMLWFSLPLIIFLVGGFSVYLVEKQWHTYVLWGSLIVSHLVALIVASVFLRKPWQKWRALALLVISISSSILTILSML
jgi:hypothetical protein